MLAVTCGDKACRRSQVRASHFHDGIGQLWWGLALERQKFGPERG